MRHYKAHNVSFIIIKARNAAKADAQLDKLGFMCMDCGKIDNFFWAIGGANHDINLPTNMFIDDPNNWLPPID